MDVQLVPLVSGPVHTRLDSLFAALGANPDLVLLQTVTNPTGLRVEEAELEHFINRCKPTTVILDECHECWSDSATPPSMSRARPNVIRVKSVSKLLAAPGLKVGWMVAGRPAAARLLQYASMMYGSPPSIFYLPRWRAWSAEAIFRASRPLTSIELGELDRSYEIVLQDAAGRVLITIAEREQWPSISPCSARTP